jgi:preprotein translocase subunit SecF
MALQLIPSDINLDFVGKRKFFVGFSLLVNITAIVLLFTVGLNYGVDFSGGSVVQIRLTQKANPDRIRKALVPLDLGEVSVQDFGTGGKEFLARFEKPKSIGSIGPRIEDALTKEFGAGQGKVVRVETVGAKVSKDLKFDAIAAITVATLLMGVFIAIQFRHVSWSFGTGAVIALVHDVLVVILALIISRLEFDLTTLAALLTVIGYSVHDTIIVSDRIREDASKRRRETLAVVMNRAINETLSRTILTSGTAISVLIALLALGGPILRPSAFTLLVGFVTGTYSSVYIAGPVVLFWESRVNIKTPRPPSARAA